MNWRKWIFYASLICIVIAGLIGLIAESNGVSYYAGLVTGLAILVLIITVTMPGKFLNAR